MVYVPFPARFKLDTLKQLDRLAELDGTSTAALIREAVHEYLMRKGN